MKQSKANQRKRKSKISKFIAKQRAWSQVVGTPGPVHKFVVGTSGVCLADRRAGLRPAALLVHIPNSAAPEFALGAPLARPGDGDPGLVRRVALPGSRVSSLGRGRLGPGIRGLGQLHFWYFWFGQKLVAGFSRDFCGTFAGEAPCQECQLLANSVFNSVCQ